MAAATIATGNHYLLDCIAGAAIGVVAVLAAGSAAGRQRRECFGAARVGNVQA